MSWLAAHFTLAATTLQTPPPWWPPTMRFNYREYCSFQPSTPTHPLTPNSKEKKLSSVPLTLHGGMCSFNRITTSDSRVTFAENLAQLRVDTPPPPPPTPPTERPNQIVIATRSSTMRNAIVEWDLSAPTNKILIKFLIQFWNLD